MTCIMIPHEPMKMTLVFGYGELFKENVYEQVEYATQVCDIKRPSSNSFDLDSVLYSESPFAPPSQHRPRPAVPLLHLSDPHG